MSMRSTVVSLIAIAVLFPSFEVFSKNKFQTPEKTKYRVQAEHEEEAPPPFTSRYKLNTLLGMNTVGGPALVVGGELGYQVKMTSPLFIGPEVNYSLDNGTSLLMALIGAWYEVKIRDLRGVGLGLLVGDGISSNFHGLSPNNLAVFLDLAVEREFDEYVAARLQFRPGFVKRFFCVIAGLSISFRL